VGGYLVIVPIVTHIVIGIILKVEGYEQGSPYIKGYAVFFVYTPKYLKSKMMDN